MRFNKKTFLIAVSLFALLGIAGCNTLKGLGRDIDSIFSTVHLMPAERLGQAGEENDTEPVVDFGGNQCPAVKIVDNLGEMVEFSDPQKPTAKGELSRLSITGVKSTCKEEDDHMESSIEISFKGTLKPKARVKSSDKPSFAYPYFIAVVDDGGRLLSKEMFAVSVRYDSKENEIYQSETISQQMPKYIDGNYNILIGFQLSDEQLEFNKAHAE